MIVCICRAKSDRDIARAIEDGASSLRDLQRCGIGTDCGSCHNMLQQMIHAAAAEPHVAPAPVPVPQPALATSA